jgi:hypothetical protein
MREWKSAKDKSSYFDSRHCGDSNSRSRTSVYDVQWQIYFADEPSRDRARWCLQLRIPVKRGVGNNKLLTWSLVLGGADPRT